MHCITGKSSWHTTVLQSTTGRCYTRCYHQTNEAVTLQAENKCRASRQHLDYPSEQHFSQSSMPASSALALSSPLASLAVSESSLLLCLVRSALLPELKKRGSGWGASGSRFLFVRIYVTTLMEIGRVFNKTDWFLRLANFELSHWIDLDEHQCGTHETTLPIPKQEKQRSYCLTLPYSDTKVTSGICERSVKMMRSCFIVSAGAISTWLILPCCFIRTLLQRGAHAWALLSFRNGSLVTRKELLHTCCGLPAAEHSKQHLMS